MDLAPAMSWSDGKFMSGAKKFGSSADNIAAGVNVIVKTAELLKEPTVAKTASLVTSVGAVAMLMPFPYGFIAGSLF